MIFNSLYFPYRVGGAEISVQLLAEELARRGNIVRVVTLHEKKIREEKEINGVTVIRLPLRNLYWPFKANKHSKLKRFAWHILDTYNLLMSKSVLNEILSFSPDVVHTNNLSGFSVCVWNEVKRNNIRLVHTSRDYYLFHPNSTLFNKGKIISPSNKTVALWSYIKRMHSKKVDAYIGISEYIRNLHVQNGFFSNSKSDVIYNSVEKIDCPKPTYEPINVGFLGRLSYEKGFDEYCQLANKYKNNSGYKFISAGNFQDEQSKKNLGKLAIDSGVSVIGYMELKDFLATVDIVVLPIKWHEPFGRTIVECALAGKVVVTTPVGALCELANIMNNIIIDENIFDGFKAGVLVVKDTLVTQSVIDIFKPEVIAEKYSATYSICNN